jgi:hypothetical protein
MFCKCRLAGADFSPGPEGSVIDFSGAMLIINTACTHYSRHLQSHWLSVSVMSLVSQPDPSACSNEHNVEVQVKIDTERDDGSQ